MRLRNYRLSTEHIANVDLYDAHFILVDRIAHIEVIKQVGPLTSRPEDHGYKFNSPGTLPKECTPEALRIAMREAGCALRVIWLRPEDLEPA